MKREKNGVVIETTVQQRI